MLFFILNQYTYYLKQRSTFLSSYQNAYLLNKYVLCFLQIKTHTQYRLKQACTLFSLHEKPHNYLPPFLEFKILSHTEYASFSLYQNTYNLKHTSKSKCISPEVRICFFQSNTVFLVKCAQKPLCSFSFIYQNPKQHFFLYASSLNIKPFLVSSSYLQHRYFFPIDISANLLFPVKISLTHLRGMCGHLVNIRIQM